MKLCPKHPYVLVCREKPGLFVPAGCMSYKCDHCRLKKIDERTRLTVWAAAQVDWVRFITLTLCPKDWQQCRMQVRDYIRRCRGTYKLEAAWAREENPLKTGYHCHLVTWGEHMPRGRLESMWGGRFVHIKPIKCEGAEYITKIQRMSGYLAKNQKTHLELNGGRSVHMTRGYLHGWTARQALGDMASGNKWELIKVARQIGNNNAKAIDVPEAHLTSLVTWDSLGDEPETTETYSTMQYDLPF